MKNEPAVNYPLTKIKEHPRTGACAWVVFFSPGNRQQGAEKTKEEALNAAAQALLAKESESANHDNTWETVPWLSNVKGR